MEAAAARAVSLAALQNQVMQLMNVVSTLQQQMTALHATVTAPSAKCPVSPPEKVGGNVKEFSAFLAQHQLYMELHARNFTSDKVKVCFLISLLKGLAAKWAAALLTPQNKVAQMEQYLEELSDGILDEVAHVDWPAALKALTHICLRIDEQLESHKQALSRSQPHPDQ
ncbi:UNVERIFIED_CONTAM: hypothetical protein K2H54_057682 [Gekko kuhli]